MEHADEKHPAESPIEKAHRRYMELRKSGRMLSVPRKFVEANHGPAGKIADEWEKRNLEIHLKMSVEQ